MICVSELDIVLGLLTLIFLGMVAYMTLGIEKKKKPRYNPSKKETKVDKQ